MADMVVNSTGMKAVRKEQVLAYEIEAFSTPQEEGEPITGYYLIVKINRGSDPDVVWEEAETLETILAIADDFRDSLE